MCVHLFIYLEGCCRQWAKQVKRPCVCLGRPLWLEYREGGAWAGAEHRREIEGQGLVGS